MRHDTRASKNYHLTWLLTWAVPVTLQLALSLLLTGAGVAGTAKFLFWLVVIAAGGCLITSGAVLARAAKRQEAELAYLGLFFLAMSILPFVHGLTTPGVLYGDNQATTASVQLSVPIALLLATPLLLQARFRIVHHPRFAIWWSSVWVVWLIAAAVGLLVSPDVVPALGARTWPAMLVATAGAVGCIALGRRHLYLAQVAGSRVPLVMAVGYGFVGASTLVWFGAEPMSLPFWVAHSLDITGVFAGTVGAMLALRSTNAVRSVIEPVLTVEPLAALELGVDPAVHRFVADLEACDQTTRDHVVRTAELAVKVGVELGLDGRDLRRLGLTGLLHDIGKLDIPNEILTKPDRLTDREYRVMKRHVELGQAIVESSPALAEIGVFVRGHHERMDGTGYPDGRVGETIPLISRIVAVCDGFDAMANTRHYRDGMGTERALAILREHAGTQWDPVIVEATEAVIRRDPPVDGAAFESIGRPDDCQDEVADLPVGCDCLPTSAMSSLS